MYLTQGLHRAVQHHPHAVATVCGARVRTHRESLDRIARLAAGLRALGIRDGDRAAILCMNSDRYLECVAGILWAGGVVVPVNWRWAVAEIGDSLVEVDARVLVVDDAFAAQAAGIRALHTRLEHVIHAGDGPGCDGALAFEQLIAEHEPVGDARRGGGDLAFVCYTGGTTGQAKGVMLSHAGLLTSALGTLATGHLLNEDAVYLHAAPMFHLADLAYWTMQVVRGGRHVIIPMFDPVSVMSAVSEHGITDLFLVPTMVQLLVDHPRIAEFELGSVQRLAYAASPMSQGVLDRAMRALPDALFTQLYGMTELSPCATVLSPADHRHPAHRRATGRALAHSEVQIVDPDDVEVPRGEAGEVVVRGAHVMLGYWNRPTETAHALRGGWMHTGDGGLMDEEGYIYLTDRIKDMIITGGENVYSVEVENVLCQHPAVATAAVIGVPDDVWGERVHAVVVPVAGQTITLDELMSFCKERTAGYKTPRSLDLVDELPLSPAGKVLKRELRRPYWEGHARAVH
ncbi:MAG TPA: long-chain-fatty-acid--CoA ligase [Solirubrobacteraceae bacterium]|nr:long-chain-fatty-acid--CoA ligase [Solirubrobacteraceae bacterium]